MSYEDTGMEREVRAINDEIQEENEENYARYEDGDEEE